MRPPWQELRRAFWPLRADHRPGPLDEEHIRPARRSCTCIRSPARGAGISVVDAGLAVDKGDHRAPDQPPSPFPPRSFRQAALAGIGNHSSRGGPVDLGGIAAAWDGSRAHDGGIFACDAWG